MLLDPNNYYTYKLRGKERLYFDREEALFSIYQYLDHILSYREGIVLSIIHEKQYKNPTGKHAEINPHSLDTQKSKDYEKWREGQRGYKGIDKYFVWDYEEVDKSLHKPNSFHYTFNHYQLGERGVQVKHLEFLEKQSDNALIGIAFAFLTFLNRHTPLQKSKLKHYYYATGMCVQASNTFDIDEYGAIFIPSHTEPMIRTMVDYRKIPNEQFYRRLKIANEGIGIPDLEDKIDLAYEIFLKNKQRLRGTNHTGGIDLFFEDANVDLFNEIQKLNTYLDK